MNLFIMPHPPLAVAEVGQGHEKSIPKTIAGMNKIAEQIKAIAPKTIAIISPHGNVFSDGLCINIEDSLTGSFTQYHQPRLRIDVKGDLQKALVLCSGLRASGINCLALDEVTAEKYSISTEIDHGALVPLYFIMKQYIDFKLLHINSGFLPKAQMYQAGKILSEILGEGNVIIASGDLSHRLSEEESQEYDEMGAVYDEYIVKAIEDSDFLKVLSADEKMVERAGQCAHKPMEMLMGALDGFVSEGQVYSYESPFGVGYMTASIERSSADKEQLIDQYLEIKKGINEKKKAKEDEYVKLARDTIVHYVKNRKKPELPENLSEDLYVKQCGVFVSIKREGRLRGCIGTVMPTKPSIAEEIMDNAIEASTKDSRFTEVQENELEDLDIFVDVLSELEKVSDRKELDIKKYGIVVTKDYRRGLLLPNLDGVDSVDHQVAIALEKAEISQDEDFTIERFTVERHKILS